ncbi:MAG: RNA methyltransferase, partial [Pseudomonadota bacterium]|nr:RNA methyltransferase [Pseudomonadota bacterium]
MTAIVLVEPSLPENVGAAARALANFGMTDLRLVSPVASADHPRAIAAAAHGVAVLRAARTFPTLAEALADRRRVWATSARRPELPLPTLDPRALGAALRRAEADDAAPAVVFGPERTGLRYEHFARVDAIVSVPTDPACPSLNLGLAVGIVAWEWAAAGLGGAGLGGA